MIIKDKKQWDDLNRPLDKIEDFILNFAKDRNYEVDKNYHNWPSRSLKWLPKDKINRKLEISLNNNLETFKVIGYAWHDEINNKRYAKKIKFNDRISPPLQSELEKFLSQYIEILNSISRDDLEAC